MDDIVRPGRGARDGDVAGDHDYYARWWDHGDPWLSPADTAAICAESADTQPGVNPWSIEWATPLGELLNEYPVLGDFLEAAAYAGHTGAVGDGLVATIRASCRWARANAEAFMAGHPVDSTHIAGDIATLHKLRELIELELHALEAVAARIQAVAGPQTEVSCDE